MGKEYEQKIINGTPASQGQAEGKVCLVLTEKDFSKFKRGNVLVAKYTDPMYTPLILMASAVVTDIGTNLCHAAIVSREAGVPAVVATGNATKMLKDGDSISVDGSSGEIVLIIR